MIDLVGTPPFLRIVLQVAMAIMHLARSPNRSIFEKRFLRIESNLTPKRNCTLRMQGRSNRMRE